MFSLCAAMKWAHLPNLGGLYDQDPELLEQFRYIFHAQGEEDARKAKEREREMGKRPSGGRRVAGHRR
jgi:hypothetical protein